MNSMQTTTSMTQGRVTATRALSGAAVVAIAAVTVAVAWGLLSRGNPGTSAASQRDPLAQPAVVQFRNSERAEAPARVTDLLGAPSLIQFRQSERSQAAGAWSASDPLGAPSIIQFRNSEHAEAAAGGRVNSDPLAAPSKVQFRQSEHTEAAR